MSLYVNYLVLGMVYFGLSLGGDKFGVDPFLYMTLSGVMELPGSTLTIPLVEKIGRRPSSATCFFITAGALLVLGVTPSGRLNCKGIRMVGGFIAMKDNIVNVIYITKVFTHIEVLFSYIGNMKVIYSYITPNRY